MIVYNIDRSFYPLKGDAIAHCMRHGHKRANIHKITVTNRDQLAALLNGLCTPAPEAPSPLSHATVERSVPDFVPDFLRRSGALS